jgi:hypothetical protein
MVRVTTQVPLWIDRDARNPDEALPFVDVTVGGRPTRTLLDTGAARTAIAPPDGVAVETKASNGTGVFGEGTGTRRVWRTTLELGHRRLTAVEVDARVGEATTDLVGQDVLSRFRCEYRLDDARLRLDGPSPHTTEPVFLDRGGHVYLEARWDEAAEGSRASANAVFDTGASLSVVDAAFAGRYPHLFRPCGISAGTDASGATVETPVAEMAGPVILGRRFRETRAAVVDLSRVNASLERPMDVILGWPVLRQANWFIDHASRSAALVE